MASSREVYIFQSTQEGKLTSLISEIDTKTKQNNNNNNKTNKQTNEYINT